MTTLPDFLITQIEADEAVARAAMKPRRADDGRWSVGDHPMDERRIEGIGIEIYDEGGHDEHQAAHIARHDPARVLRECAAKRAIVELRETLVNDGDRSIAARLTTPSVVATLDATLRVLASVYADREGFDAGWLG